MQYNIIKHESGTEANYIGTEKGIQASINLTIFNLFILKCIGL